MQHFLDAAGRASPLDEDDEINRFRDQPARYGCYGLLDQLLNPVERRAGGVSVYCCDAAGMAGVPGLQHVEGLGSPHLADNDAIGTQAKGGTHEVGEIRNARLGAERNGILGIAPELAGVLNNDDSFVEARDLGQKRIGNPIDRRSPAHRGRIRRASVGTSG